VTTEPTSPPAAAEPTSPPAAVEPTPPPAAVEPLPPPAVVEPVPIAEPAPEPAAAKPKPPPYSLPWQLRSVIPANVVRSDTAIGFYQGPTTRGGTAAVSTLLASYKVIPELAPLVRLGLVSNAPPTDKSARNDFLNPVIGALFGPKIHENLKLGLFLGFALPFGTAGGDDPHPQSAFATNAGIATRSAMDNAMFAANYFTVFPGVGFAYVGHGFTAQVEATVLQLTKTRGPDTVTMGGKSYEADESNTNFTMGLHAGYFVIPALSFGAELRHQRWLSTPLAVELDKTGTLRDTTTMAVGPRAHVKLGEKMWLRPGIAFAFPLDNPMANGKAYSHYKIVQIDVPFVF
jgi:hypothetical protein